MQPVQFDDALPALGVDLLAASYRSDTFPADWSSEAREAAHLRYRKWLGLIRRHPRVRMAPTRDIDLFWHLHMLAPVAYVGDCTRLFGYVLDHDGGFGKGDGELPVLQHVFDQTAACWEAEYNEPYREDGTWLREATMTDCWHDCANRCWHACSSKAHVDASIDG